jgi:penicillin-binding protein 2
MATSDNNLAEHSGSLVESHKSYDPRMVSFYFVLALMLVILTTGLGYQQLFKSESYTEQERVQSQRRVIVPGPRGNIYARDGTTVLVGNRPRFSVVLYLDELKSEFVKEASVIRKNYKASGIKDIPSSDFSKIARVSVVQRYLDQVNRVLAREDKVDPAALNRHFSEQLLLPYKLVEDLTEDEYARLIERLPVRSPLQVYTSNSRYYPFGSAAAHALGYVRTHIAGKTEDEDLATSKMPGFIGKTGLEQIYDQKLQGKSGGALIRVDPAGYKVTAIEKQLPVQGESLVSSLDIHLQLAAEQQIGDQVGAAVAIEVATGEVLAMVSKPDYNLNEMSPRVSSAKYAEIQERGGEVNRAISGAYPPGSTFKILTTIAGLRAGRITPDQSIINCDGVIRIGGRTFYCDNGRGHHHDVTLKDAIAYSCDIYYYELGKLLTPDGLAAEGRHFHMDKPTGIDLPYETRRMVMPDPAYKKRLFDESWYPGDTANMSIGQGFVLVTPLEMACFAASVARNEITTQPTMLHDPKGQRQHSEPIGLTPAQRQAIIEGMVGCTTYGTAKILDTPMFKIPGVRIAGKTGTAQKTVRQGDKVGTINYAWFISFAPADNPEIAVAVMLEGDEIGETFGGGANAGPVAGAIYKKYFERKNAPVPKFDLSK